MEEELETLCFGLIAAAGAARSQAFKALKAARSGDFDRADELLKEAKQSALEAHHVQTSLLSKEAAGDHTEVNVMLVHAQDHLMCSILAQELIEELVYLHRVKADRSEDAAPQNA